MQRYLQDATLPAGRDVTCRRIRPYLQKDTTLLAEGYNYLQKDATYLQKDATYLQKDATLLAEGCNLPRVVDILDGVGELGAWDHVAGVVLVGTESVRGTGHVAQKVFNAFVVTPRVIGSRPHALREVV